jgi:hypothetical protein
MTGTQVFRGYRAFVAALSAGLALIAASLQPTLVADPVNDLIRYCGLWSWAAGVAVALTVVDLSCRWIQDATGREKVRILQASKAMLPCIATGAIATIVIVRFAPSLGWTLPALWSLLFAQGVFASAAILPAAVWAVGIYYVLAAITVLIFGQGTEALAPWTMVVPFGVGQAAAATVLYFSLERRDDRAE